jgi:hypothetical protein
MSCSDQPAPLLITDLLFSCNLRVAQNCGKYFTTFHPPLTQLVGGDTTKVPRIFAFITSKAGLRTPDKEKAALSAAFLINP